MTRLVALPNSTEGTGPRLCLVHGFTQSASSWGPVTRPLVGDHEVVTVDLPGHGAASDWPDTEPRDCGLPAAAQALGAAGGRATYVGYSLGGRCALHLALGQSSGLVERLVVVGAHPGLSDPAQAAQRCRSDGELADRLERTGDPGLEDFLGDWLAGPLFAHLTATQVDLASRRVNTARGLAHSLRTMGTGVQRPLWDDLAELSMPVLVVAGELDARFRAIGEDTVRAIGDNARMAVVEGAGHAAPFERPEAFAALVRSFVAGG